MDLKLREIINQYSGHRHVVNLRGRGTIELLGAKVLFFVVFGSKMLGGQISNRQKSKQNQCGGQCDAQITVFRHFHPCPLIFSKF